MPIKVTCPNADCKAVFTVGDEMAGDTVTCPRCGESVDVTGGSGADDGLAFADGVGGADEGGGSGHVHHPARLTCSACGAVLGVRDAFCPNCGADVRTGQAVMVAPTAKRRNLLPFIIGGVAVVAVIVIVLVVVLGGKKGAQVAQDGQGGAPPAAAPAPEGRPAPAAQAPKAPVPDAPAGGGRPQPMEPVRGGRPGGSRGGASADRATPAAATFEVPAEALAPLRAEADKARQAAADYVARLREGLGQIAGAEGDARAAVWADLYEFCRGKGLDTEAELCWMQAVRLQPAAAAVKQKLGVTESSNGVPVTPEQKAFLDSLRPRLRFLNLEPALGDNTIRVVDVAEAPFERGKTAAFSVDPGTVQVEIVPTGNTERVTLGFAFEAEPALAYTLGIRRAGTAPALPFDDLSTLYGVVQQGATAEGVSAERDMEGKLVRASYGDLTVAAEPGGTLQMQLSGTDLAVYGRLTMGDRFADEGQHVFCGGSRRSVRMTLDARAKTATVQNAVYYTLQAEPTDGLLGILAVVQGDLASAGARRKLMGTLSSIEFSNAAMEARGELLGLWQGQLRTYDELKGRHEKVLAALANQDRAAAMPAGVDRVRALGLEDRATYLYMNWPRFRRALAATMGDSGDLLRECIDALDAQASGSPTVQSTRSAPTRAMRRDVPPGAQAAGQGLAPSADVDPDLEPAAIGLNEPQRMTVLMQVLPVLSDGAAVAMVREVWSGLDPEARAAAMVSLEQIASPEAVAFLAEVSRNVSSPDEAALALLSLGVIGTPEALEHCETLALSADIRAAATVAKAVGGDPETLDGLGEFLQKADADTRALAATFASDRIATPAALLVLSQAVDACDDAASRQEIALSLASIGGSAAMSELGRLMTASGQSYPEALAAVNAKEAPTVLESVGQALAAGKGDDAAASLLMRNGSPAALAYLSGAARSGNGTVVRALLNEGSAEMIELAAAGARAVNLDLLRILRARWYVTDEATGGPRWSPGVEELPVRYFLEQVLEKGAEPTVRLAAATMLSEIGLTPDSDVLLTLAAEGGGAAEKRSRTAQYSPPGYEAPEPVSDFLEDFKFEGKSQVFALRLLAMHGDAATAEKLHGLTEGYSDTQLKAEGMRALGELGRESDLEWLRTLASAQKDRYADLKEIVAEAQDKVAALVALGAAKDAEFLPKLVDMIQQSAPEPGSALGVEEDPEVFKAWWEIYLRTHACRCVTEMCSGRPLAMLTGDSALQQRLLQQLMAILQETSAPVSSLFDAAGDLRAEAVRAFGRAASPTAENRVVIDRLAEALTQVRSGPRRTQLTPGGVTASARQREAQDEALACATLEAATFLAARATQPESYFGLIDSLRTRGRMGDWNKAVRALAQDPTPGFLQVVGQYSDDVQPRTRGVVMASLSGRGSADPQYAQWLVAMVAGPIEVVEAAPAEEVGPRRRRAQSTVDWEARRAGAAAQEQEILREMGATATGGPPQGLVSLEELEGRPSAAELQRDRRTRGREQEVRREVSCKRATPRRYVEWSCAIDGLAARASALRAKWSLAQKLFEADPGALSAALAKRSLVGSDFAPAIAALYVERNPAAQAEIVSQLGDALLDGPSDNTGGVPRLRALVAALSRIGGEAAADALYLGLVGPIAEQPAAVATRGMPGMVMMDTGMSMGPGVRSSGPDRSGIAAYIARALGALGRDDLLGKALNAQGHEFFNAGATTVQMAVLEGLAYLPAERDPLQQLERLIRLASTPTVRAATGRAMVKAMRNLAAQ